MHVIIEFLEQTVEQYHKEIYFEKYLDKDKSLMKEKNEDFLYIIKYEKFCKNLIDKINQIKPRRSSKKTSKQKIYY